MELGTTVIILAVIWMLALSSAASFCLWTVRQMRRDAALRRAIKRAANDGYRAQQEERLQHWANRYADESGIRRSDPPPPNERAA